MDLAIAGVRTGWQCQQIAPLCLLWSLPVSAALSYASAPSQPVYPKRLGLFPNPAVREELARLDPRRDCERMVHLLSAYEFTWDFQRALELALFYTYGSPSISRLLVKTGQFRDHGQKRYDDTKILIALFIEEGYTQGRGCDAIARMNRSHGHYRIPNDDFLFVLWTFMEFPIQWTAQYSYRAMTAHEQQGWFYFWKGLGERMGLHSIPPDKATFDQWIRAYKTREFRYDPLNAELAGITSAILKNMFPEPLRPIVQPVISCLMDAEFLYTIGWQQPAPALRWMVSQSLRAVSRAQSQVLPGPYPSLIANQPPTQTYPDGQFEVKRLAPDSLLQAERLQDKQKEARQSQHH